jgi:hypothetical protein
VPPSVTLRSARPASVPSFSVAAHAPVAVGVKRSVTWHVPATGMLEHVDATMAKSAAPSRATLVRPSGASPWLASVTVAVAAVAALAAVWPMVVAGNVTPVLSRSAVGSSGVIVTDGVVVVARAISGFTAAAETKLEPPPPPAVPSAVPLALAAAPAPPNQPPPLKACVPSVAPAPPTTRHSTRPGWTGRSAVSMVPRRSMSFVRCLARSTTTADRAA